MQDPRVLLHTIFGCPERNGRKVANTKRTGKAMLFGEDGGASVGSVNYTIHEHGCDLQISTRLTQQPQQAVLQTGAERGYACERPQALDGPIHGKLTDPAAVWVLCAGKPAAHARLGNAALDKAKARAALDAALRMTPKTMQASPSAPKEEPGAIHVAKAQTAIPTPKPPPLQAAPGTDASAKTDIGFNMQTTGGGAPASSFRRREPYGLSGPPDAAVFEIVQPVRSAEPTVAQPSQELSTEPPQRLPPPPSTHTQEGIDAAGNEATPAQVSPAIGPEPGSEPDPAQAAPAAPTAKDRKAAPMGITVKRAAPLTMPRDTPLWADIAPHVESMLDTLPQAQPFASAVDSAQFATLPLDGAAQCYIGSVIVGGVKVLLQAVPSRPFHRPAGFDHTLISREGDSYWVRYEVEN